jgi:hypothetical protein
MMAKGQRPHARRTLRRGVHLHDAANHGAVGVVHGARAGRRAMASAAASLRCPLLQAHNHGRPKGSEPLQDRGANLVRQALEIHAATGLRADDGNVLLASSVLRVLQKVGAELYLFGLEPFDFRADVGQVVSGMTV